MIYNNYLFLSFDCHILFLKVLTTLSDVYFYKHTWHFIVCWWNPEEMHIWLKIFGICLDESAENWSNFFKLDISKHLLMSCVFCSSSQWLCVKSLFHTFRISKNLSRRAHFSVLGMVRLVHCRAFCGKKNTSLLDFRQLQ